MRSQPSFLALAVLLASAALVRPASAQPAGDADCRADALDPGDPGGSVNPRTGCLSLPLLIGGLSFVLDEHGAPEPGIAGLRTRLEGFGDSIEMRDGRAFLRTASGEQAFVFDPATGRWAPSVADGFAPEGTELACNASGCQLLQAGVATRVFEDARGGRFHLSRLQEWGGPNAAPHVTGTVTVERPAGQVHPTRIGDNRGWAAVLHYNADGTLQHVTDRFGRDTTLAYSAGGRLATLAHPGPDGGTLHEVLTYGPDGLLQYRVAPDGTGVRFDRHPGGRVAAAVDVVASAAGGTTPSISELRQRGGVTFGYGGSLAGFTAAITEVRASLGQVEKIGFETVAGRPRVTVSEDATGFLTTYTYDPAAAGRLTSVRGQDGTGAAYTYEDYRLSRIDRIETGGQHRCYWTGGSWANGWVPQQVSRCGSGVVNTTYDAINRPVTVSDGINTWSYVRTGSALQTLLTISLNDVVQGDVTFDGRGDAVAVAEGSGAARRVIETVTRDAASGLPLGRVFVDGTTRTYGGRDSNPFKVPTQITETGRPTLSVDIDAWGNVTSGTYGPQSASQAYDELGRPTGATLTNPRRPVPQTRGLTWLEDRPTGQSVNGEDSIQIQPVDPELPPLVPTPALNRNGIPLDPNNLPNSEGSHVH